MSRGAKWIILSSAAVLALGTLAAILYAVWPYIYAGDIEAEIAALRSQGKPVTASDLVPQGIPDSENAALVYEKAFSLLPRSSARLGPAGQTATNWYAPRNADYWQNARNDVEAADKAMALAARAARMPRCAFAVGWERGQQTPVQHIARLRTLSRLFALRATIHAREGRTQAAVEDLATTIGISQSIRYEPAMVSALCQSFVLGTMARGLAECLSYGRLDARQARLLYDKLGRVDLPASFVRALEGERAMQLSLLDRIEKRAIPDASEVGGNIETVLRRFAGNPLLKAQLRVEKRAFLREMARAIDDADLSYRDIVLRRQRSNETERSFSRALIAQTLVPMWDRSRAARDRAVASVAGSRIVLALEAHWEQNQRYPDGLEELRTEPGWQIEQDPFSTKDFVYKKLPGGFLLYSIGEDFQNDGGSPDGNREQRSSGSFGRRGDIVWRVER